MDGNKLKILRTEKRMSLGKLSERTGISKSYLSLIERNIQKNPSIDILEKLAKAFKVTVEDLVRREQEDPPFFCNGVPQVTSKIKVEIELSNDHLTPEKIKRIKELIDALNSD